MKNLWRKDTIYDVAIIGAGPAGASLAYFLSDFK
jgi:flavin-dependent dehydrogenase